MKPKGSERGAGRARREQSIHKRLINVSRKDALERLKVSASPVAAAQPLGPKCNKARTQGKLKGSVHSHIYTVVLTCLSLTVMDDSLCLNTKQETIAKHIVLAVIVSGDCNEHNVPCGFVPC